MFRSLFTALLGQEARKTTATLTNACCDDPDAAHALGALLVRVARADVADATAQLDALNHELDRIERLLLQLYGLSARDAAAMRATCEALEQRAPDTEIFTEMIRQGVDFDDRLQALETLWQQSLKEGGGDQSSRRRLTRVQSALGLTDADSVLARSQALEHV